MDLIKKPIFTNSFPMHHILMRDYLIVVTSKMSCNVFFSKIVNSIPPQYAFTFEVEFQSPESVPWYLHQYNYLVWSYLTIGLSDFAKFLQLASPLIVRVLSRLLTTQK